VQSWRRPLDARIDDGEWGHETGPGQRDAGGTVPDAAAVYVQTPS